MHCLRAPIGGLYRHVSDLATEQTEMGHRVGVICDANNYGDAAESALRNLAETVCDLGVTRVKMSRQLGLRDFTASAAVKRLARQTEAQILHGHGAKGGAYARLAARALKRSGQDMRVFYTPHGGALHYSPESLKGRIFMALERKLLGFTDGLIFESDYAARLYQAHVGKPTCETRIVLNGLRPQEFYDVVLDVDAADFVFVGELRDLKGVDVLLKALSEVRGRRPAKAFIAGTGPDAKKFSTLARKLDVSEAVTFAGHVPARAAFPRGQCLVVPSRLESLPYVVLEAAAARMPIIATHVGGIPEIVEGTDVTLIPPDDVHALSNQMLAFLAKPATFAERAAQLQTAVSKRFTVANMTRNITHFYVSRLLDPAK
ncbi:MAG: glycosyltransferase family 4 protein [Pseudomonadota bacterium]